MAYDEKRIIEIILARFKERLSQIKDKADFEDFLNNLTKSKVKNFIKNTLEEEAAKRDQFSVDEAETAIDIRKIKDYINTT